LDGTTLYANLTYVTGDFAIAKSTVGTFDIALLNNLLKMLLAGGVVPEVNTKLKKGFPLPTVKGVTFVSPVLGWGDHYLYISSDLTYTPPSKYSKIKIA
jgi:hypothetical protein